MGSTGVLRSKERVCNHHLVKCECVWTVKILLPIFRKKEKWLGSVSKDQGGNSVHL